MAAEQLLIEIIVDNSQLLPTIELLQKIGQLTQQEADYYKKLAAESTKAFQAANDTGKKLIPTLSDIDKKTILLSDTFKDTFQKEVQDAFSKSGTTLQEFIKKLSAVGNPTPLNNLRLQLANMLSQITQMAGKLDTIKLTPGGVDTTEFKNLENEFTAAFETAGQLTAQIEELENAEKAAGTSQGSFRTQIHDTTEALARQLSTGELTAAQIYELAKSGGVLKNSYSDAARAIAVLSSNTFALDATLQGVQAVAAGFQLAQGAEALFGSENKDLQELLVKLNAIMAITTGLQQLSILLRKEEAVSLAARVLQQKLGNAQQLIENGLNSQSVIVRGAAAVAQRILNAAMAANPIGLLVTVLATVIGLFATYKLTLGKATDEENRHALAVAAMNEAHSKAADAIAQEEGSLELLIAKGKDVNLTYQERQDTIDKIRASYPEYLRNISLENIYTADLSTAISKQIALIKQRALIQATEEIYKDRLKKVIDAQNELNRVTEEGASPWEKLVASAKDFNNWFRLVSPQQEVVNEKMGDLNTAIEDADESFGNFTKTISDGSQEGVDALSKYINQFNLFADKANSFTLTFPVQPKQFDPKQADDDKKQALALAQYRIDIATKGSAEEFAARKALADTEYEYEKDAAGTNLTLLKLAEIKHNTEIFQLRQSAAQAGLQLADRNAKALFEIDERHLQQEADLYKSIVDNEKQPYELRLGLQKNYIAASLALLEKQKQDEISALERQKQAELSADGVTAVERKNIIDKYNVEVQKVLADGYKQRNDLIAGYNQQLKEQDAASFTSIIDAQQKRMQTMLDNVDKAFAAIGKNNSGEKNDRLTQIEKDYKSGILTATEAQQKLNDLDDEFDSRALGNQKVSLEAKLSNLKFLYDHQLISQEDYNTQSEKLQSDLNDANKQLLDKDVQNAQNSEEQKLEATKARIQEQEQLFQDALQFIQTGIESLGDNFTSGISSAVLNVFSVMKKSADDLKLKLDGIEKDTKLTAIEKQAKAAGAEADATAEKIGAAFTATQAIINAAFQRSYEARKQQVDSEIGKLEDRKNAELSNTELTEAQRAAIEKRYAAQESRIKNEAATKQRQADIAQAIVNGLLAAGNALATVKPFIPTALIAAGLAATLAGIQVANIKSAPLPAFKKGTRHAPAGYALVGEEGPEIVKLRGGEKIYTTKESRIIEKRWEKERLKESYIHPVVFETGKPKLAHYDNIPQVIPSPFDVIASLIPRPVDKVIIERSSTEKNKSIEIDYIELGKQVAEHMKDVVKDMPQTNYELDNDDIRKVVRKGNQTDIILNKKGKLTKN